MKKHYLNPTKSSRNKSVNNNDATNKSVNNNDTRNKYEEVSIDNKTEEKEISLRAAYNLYGLTGIIRRYHDYMNNRDAYIAYDDRVSNISTQTGSIHTNETNIKPVLGILAGGLLIAALSTVALHICTGLILASVATFTAIQLVTLISAAVYIASNSIQSKLSDTTVEQEELITNNI